MISMKMAKSATRIAMPILALACAAPLEAQSAASPPERDYLVYVVSESADEISVVRFGREGARVERRVETGVMATDVDGPHGVDVSPAGDHYYVSLGHGKPFGTLLKYRASDDRVVGQVALGLFPATLDVSPDGGLAYVVNFNLHGDAVPSSVSVVVTEPMIEAARIPTCVMPHGSRLNAQGTRHYSACMMDDAVVEIDTERLRVARHFVLTAGSERGMEGPLVRAEDGAHADHRSMASRLTCSPTWAQPSVDGSRLYVACNKSNQVVEIDVGAWTVARRFAAGDGVYNLAATPDGRYLVATNKRGQSVSVFDLASGREAARLATGRRVVHGVAVSPDSRYAFVSVEAVGDEPGSVEVVDLQALRTVARVDVGHQAAGIDFWKTETR